MNLLKLLKELYTAGDVAESNLAELLSAKIAVTYLKKREDLGEKTYILEVTGIEYDLELNTFVLTTKRPLLELV